MVMTIPGVVDAALAARVRALAAAIEHQPPAGMVEVVPAFSSVAVFHDPALAGGYARLSRELEALADRSELAVVSQQPREVEIPVCYGGAHGLDLESVAARCGLAAREVVALHAGADYLVHAIGFVPGFPYLGGLPDRLATPRRPTVRREVPAGSVGIGGAQTGIYPLATPGGWNLIGRTPRRLFDQARAEAALLRAGDRVRFRPVESDTYEDLAVAEVTEELSPDVGSADGTDGAGAIEVIRPGMFTTVQDLGRVGHRAEGVVASGAVDLLALRLANLLVGNSENVAGLEFTLVGPELRFRRDTLVALGGGECDGLPAWLPLRVTAGTRLRLGPLRRGCRGYVAFAGGLEVPPALGSRSTYVRAGLGGLAGRPLQAGDVLHLPEVHREVTGNWRIDERILPSYSDAPEVRVLRGAQDQGLEEFCGDDFVLTTQADRMGARLRGPVLSRRPADDLVSSPVAPGTVQVPPDGQPIVLLADAQTIGGYPQLAHIASVDLPLVAQLRPGDRLRFREVTLDEAHELAVDRERDIAMLREGLAQKFA